METAERDARSSSNITSLSDRELVRRRECGGDRSHLLGGQGITVNGDITSLTFVVSDVDLVFGAFECGGNCLRNCRGAGNASCHAIDLEGGLRRLRVVVLNVVVIGGRVFLAGASSKHEGTGKRRKKKKFHVVS